MSSESESPAGDLLWQKARKNYEDPANCLADIAASLGMNRFKLVAEARRRGWKPRTITKRGGTRATIQRFKELLQSRLAQLENQLGELCAEAAAATNERDIRATNLLVRTLEKVLELERKERAHRARKIRERRNFDDAARDELARRIRGMLPAEGGGQPEPEPSDGSSVEPAAGLAPLGTASPADSA